jgi:symplekin
MDSVDNALEQADALSAESAGLPPDLMSLGPVVLPQPPPMTEEEASEVGRGAIGRVFGMLASTEAAPKPAKGKSQQQLGFARLAGSTFDRDAWVVLLTRLATRAPAGLGVEGNQTGPEQAVQTKKPTISDSIRETLYRYILEDFRGRLSIGITWLNEEWYNDHVQTEFSLSQHGPDADERLVPFHYEHWALRLLDGILPYLDARDTKLFIRFLSEIPEVTASTTQRVASLAKDPERVNLCVQALLYVLVTFLASRKGPPLTVSDTLSCSGHRREKSA